MITSDFNNAILSFHKAVDKLSNEQPKNIFTSIFYRITMWFNNGSNEKASQQIFTIALQVEKILVALQEEMQDLQSLQNQLGNKEFKNVLAGNEVISREVLQQFCDDMDRLFKEIYPLVKTSPFSTTNKMPMPVQEYFSADLKKLRKEKAMDPSKVSDDDHRTARKIAKGKLAITFGRGVKRNAGSTGTLIILDVNQKPVGIHKISKQNVPLTTRVKNFFKVLMGGQLSCLSHSDFAQPMAEKASYILSKGLGFNLAPPSKKESLKGLVGVFQVFISKEKEGRGVEEVRKTQNIVVEHPKANPKIKGPNDYRQAAEILSQIESKETYTEEEKTLFQKLALFDYLIGNLDRHEENWLVIISHENEIIHIKAIDNANAFPKIQPEKGTMASKYQYHWKTLKISREKFTPEVVEFVRERLNFDKLQKIIEEIQSGCDHFLDEDMKNLLHIRQKVIYELICNDTYKTPADLASYSTEVEMLAYCQSSRKIA